MSVTNLPEFLAEIAQIAGVKFNGKNPWDIQINDERAYSAIISQGSLGFGNAYMEGWWECKEIDSLIYRILTSNIERKLIKTKLLRFIWEYLHSLIVNRQSLKKAFEVGEKHYDISNELFQAMLDPTMSYSCGYWYKAKNLAQAQKNKLDLICRKLDLQPGEKLLDIGCGWGGLAIHAAKNYGVEVHGITVSRQQYILAKKRFKDLPITIKVIDYRDLPKTYDHRFDKAVSVGMFEHVGPKNYRKYFEVARNCLTDEGIFLLHTIGKHRTTYRTDPWIDKHIFPNGYIPSAKQITKAIDKQFLLEDWHNFGLDYDKTLMAWWKNFNNAWSKLSNNYDQRFYRMWKYYLHCCAGFFRSRHGQLWQIVLTPITRKKNYISIR